MHHTYAESVRRRGRRARVSDEELTCVAPQRRTITLAIDLRVLPQDGARGSHVGSVRHGISYKAEASYARAEALALYLMSISMTPAPPVSCNR